MCRTLPLVIASFGLTHAAAQLTEEPLFVPHADPFLGPIASTRKSVLDEVGSSLRSEYRSDTKERLKLLEDEMRVSFEALPKTEYGNLAGSSVRYLLDRHFRRSRSWEVHGLSRDGDFWNETSPIALLRDGSAVELFSQRLRGRGLSLRDVALLAAMIENQLHQALVKRLRHAWVGLNLSEASGLSFEEGEKLVVVYLVSLLFPYLDMDWIFQNLPTVLKSIDQAFPTWNNTEHFLHEELVYSIFKGADRLKFVDLERVIVNISEHYGAFQRPQCNSIKTKLVSLEGPRPGRVPLHAFFKARLAGFWQFAESVQYMDDMGLLETRADGSQEILVANYINSPSQVVASSQDFSMVCMDECEGQLAHIELQVGTPLAEPSRIISAIDRSISRPLQEKLYQIAFIHDGVIPLHGRLFAQWMHHAYPRDCPYPHVGRGPALLTPEAYDSIHGKNLSYATAMAIEEWAAHVQSSVDSADVDLFPWENTEVLLDIAHEVSDFPRNLKSGIELIAAFAIFACLLPQLELFQRMVFYLRVRCGYVEGKFLKQV